MKYTGKRYLKNIFEEHIFTGGARGRDGILPAKLSDEINEICTLISRKSRNGSYQFTSYRQLLSSKGAGKAPRAISIPTARDRILLKALSEVIGSSFPRCRGEMPQEKIHNLNEVLLNGKFESYIRLDIENFYPSIDHKELMRVVSKRIRKPEILSLVQRAISTPTLNDRSPKKGEREVRGVPQGLSISNLLAEISFLEIDEKFASKDKIFYSRYVDDVIILCDKSDQEKIYAEFVDKCNKYSLEVHDRNASSSKTKLGLIDERIEYLGYVFDAQKVSVRPESILNIQYSISQLVSNFKKERKKVLSDPTQMHMLDNAFIWNLDLLISGCVFNGQKRGWLHYYSQINDLTVLGKLDSFVSNKLKTLDGLSSVSSASFMRTYWNITRAKNKSTHVANFDLYTIDEMRDALHRYFGYSGAKMDDHFVRINFRREINRTVSKFEKDVVGRS